MQSRTGVGLGTDIYVRVPTFYPTMVPLLHSLPATTVCVLGFRGVGFGAQG